MKRRRGFDQQGRPVSEVESPTGSFKPDLDAGRLGELRADELSLEDTVPMRRPHFSPYDRDAASGLAPSPPQAPRRSGLDALRELSEVIKRRRKRDDPPA
jgi:hypothetical protein